MLATHLFSKFKIRDATFKNRIVVSPMCQYSSENGYANDWHLIHLGSRAIGGAGLVMTEATAVQPEGRISPQDLGIWTDDHIPGLKRICGFIKQHGALAGIQLAHAGRKASTGAPWQGGQAINIAQGGWQTLAPSAIAFSENYSLPLALSKEKMQEILQAFVAASQRSQAAGFDVIEIHAAHGYLLHEFLSPLSNQRDDEYGGSFSNRCRYLLEVAQAVRNSMPASMPLFVRLSCSDWIEQAWDIQDSINLSKALKELGVDLIDASSGGNVPYAKIPIAPNYQVPFAEQIRKEANIYSGAVGMITEAHQATDIVAQGKADLIFIAREFLRNPYWPLHAAKELQAQVDWPQQYSRAAPVQMNLAKAK